jgi:hypothetical protein
MNVPTPPIGHFNWVFRGEFDGTFYRLRYRYIFRSGFWFLDIANDQSVAQVRGLKMCLSTDILDSFKHLEVPPGTLSVIDTSQSHTEAARDDFGGRVRLDYQS